MSERKVRKYGRHKKNCAASSYMAQWWGAKCNCGFWEALSADPDLVDLLRFLWREYRNPTPLMTWPGGCQVLIEKIERDFGLRLTADGWEYTRGEGE